MNLFGAGGNWSGVSRLGGEIVSHNTTDARQNLLHYWIVHYLFNNSSQLIHCFKLQVFFTVLVDYQMCLIDQFWDTATEQCRACRTICSVVNSECRYRCSSKFRRVLISDSGGWSLWDARLRGWNQKLAEMKMGKWLSKTTDARESWYESHSFHLTKCAVL